MDVKSKNSDTSINLDSSWFVLDDDDIKNIGGEGQQKTENEIEQDKKTDTQITITVKDNKAKDSLEETKVPIGDTLDGLSEFEDHQLLPIGEEGDLCKVYEERVVVYKPDFNPNFDELFIFLTSISIGTFFIIICGLSLMFVGPYNFPQKNTTNVTCPEKTTKIFKISNNNNTWFNNYYQHSDEEELIHKYCPNKYKQHLFKSKNKCSTKNKGRYIKQATRNYNNFKPIKTTKSKIKHVNITASKVMADDELQDANYRYLKYKLEEQINDYNNLKTNFDKQSVRYEELKNQCKVKNELNKRCIKLMLKEIVDLNREIKEIHRDAKKKLPERFRPDNTKRMESNLNFIINSGNKLKKSNTLSDLPHEQPDRADINDFIGDNVSEDKILTKEEHTRAKQLMKKRIDEMTKENEDIAETIKEKQQRLQELTNTISTKMRFLEYKKYILNTFQRKLQLLEEMDKNYESSNGTLYTRSPLQSQAPISIPLIYIDGKCQKSMSTAMFNDLLNSSAPRNETQNVCICEQGEEDDDLLKYNIDLEWKQRELNHVITKKLSKLTTNRLPQKKPYILMKWDDKTVWYSKKLNESEHAKLITMYPKCIPAKGWKKRDIKNDLSHSVSK